MLTVSSRANQIVEIRATYTVKGERYCIRYFDMGLRTDHRNSRTWRPRSRIGIIFTIKDDSLTYLCVSRCVIVVNKGRHPRAWQQQHNFHISPHLCRVSCQSRPTSSSSRWQSCYTTYVHVSRAVFRSQKTEHAHPPPTMHCSTVDKHH